MSNTETKAMALAMEWSCGEPEMCAQMLMAMMHLIEEEREACARVCDQRVFALDGGGNQYRREADASQCAFAIRARGVK